MQYGMHIEVLEPNDMRERVKMQQSICGKNTRRIKEMEKYAATKHYIIAFGENLQKPLYYIYRKRIYAYG